MKNFKNLPRKKLIELLERLLERLNEASTDDLIAIDTIRTLLRGEN